MRLFYSNKKRLTRIFARFFFIIVCLGALFITNPMVAHAENGDGDTTGYGPWETEDAGLYSSEYDDSTGTKEKDAVNTVASLPGGAKDQLSGSGNLATFAEHGLEWVVDILSSIVYIVAEAINKALGLGNFYTSKIDLSVSAMMLGRVYKGADYVNWVQFELQPNNPFGIIGAECYAYLRGIIFGFFPFMALYIIAKSLLTTDSKARVDLKELTFKIVICMFLLYLTPQIVHFTCYIRDLVSKGLMLNALGVDGLNIVRDFKALYFLQEGGILASMLYLASIFATFTFLKSYISIALKQMAYFGSFPIFALFGISDRKLIGEWFREFTLNVFIPTIDAVLISVPLIFVAIGSNVMSADNNVNVTAIEFSPTEMLQSIEADVQEAYNKKTKIDSPLKVLRLVKDGAGELVTFGKYENTEEKERKKQNARIESAMDALEADSDVQSFQLAVIGNDLPISFSIIAVFLMGMVVSTRNALLKLFGQRIQDTQKGGAALMGALLMAARGVGRQVAPRISQKPTPLPAGGTTGAGGGNGALGGTLDGAMSQMDNGFDNNAFKANPEEIAPTQKGPDPIETAEKENEANGTGTHNPEENINGGDSSEAYDDGDSYDETNTVSNIANDNAEDITEETGPVSQEATALNEATNDANINDGAYTPVFNNVSEEDDKAMRAIVSECSTPDSEGSNHLFNKEQYDNNRVANLGKLDSANGTIAALKNDSLENLPSPDKIKNVLGEGKSYEDYNKAYNNFRTNPNNTEYQDALKEAAPKVITDLSKKAEDFVNTEKYYSAIANNKTSAEQGINFNKVQKGLYNSKEEYDKAVKHEKSVEKLDEYRKFRDQVENEKHVAQRNQYVQLGKFSASAVNKYGPSILKAGLKATTMAAGAAVGMGMGAASGQLGSGATAGMMVGGALYNKGANAVGNKIDSARASKQQQEEVARRQKQQETRELEKAENNRKNEEERKLRVELTKEKIKTEKLRQAKLQNHSSSNSQPNTPVSYNDGGVGQKNKFASVPIENAETTLSGLGKGTGPNYNKE